MAQSANLFRLDRWTTAARMNLWDERWGRNFISREWKLWKLREILSKALTTKRVKRNLPAIPTLDPLSINTSINIFNERTSSTFCCSSFLRKPEENKMQKLKCSHEKWAEFFTDRMNSAREEFVSDKHKTFCHAFNVEVISVAHKAKNPNKFSTLLQHQTSYSYDNIYINLCCAFFRRTDEQRNFFRVEMIRGSMWKSAQTKLEWSALLLFIWRKSRWANIYLNNIAGDKYALRLVINSFRFLRHKANIKFQMEL